VLVHQKDIEKIFVQMGALEVVLKAMFNAGNPANFKTKNHYVVKSLRSDFSSYIKLQGHLLQCKLQLKSRRSDFSPL